MNEIISVSTREINGESVNSVNARELHEKLGVKKDFSDWIKPKLNDGILEEGKDYLITHLEGEKLNGGVHRPLIEYIITLDTAKHIAMMSKTEKAKEIRNYFIKIEKEFHITVDKINVLREEALALQKQKESNENLVMKLANLSLSSQKRDVSKYLQVYALRQKDLPNPMIAGALGMSVSCVENYASKLIQMGFIERS